MKIHPHNMMTKPGHTGIHRIIYATRYSFAGIRAALRHEAAFRQEAALFILLAPLALWIGEGSNEKAMLIGSLFLILIVELLNSAIEAVVDRFGGEQHELSGRAKDIGSAAVFVALINAVVVWSLLIFHEFTP